MKKICVLFYVFIFSVMANATYSAKQIKTVGHGESAAFSLMNEPEIITLYRKTAVENARGESLAKNVALCESENGQLLLTSRQFGTEVCTVEKSSFMAGVYSCAVETTALCEFL